MVPIESDGHSGLSDSIARLKAQFKQQEPILTPERYEAEQNELEAGLERFVNPLKDLLANCKAREKRILEILDNFISTDNAKSISHAAGTRSPIYQNENILTPLLKKFPEQVAKMRQEKRDFIDDVQALDNIAIVAADLKPTDLIASSPNEVMKTYKLEAVNPLYPPSPADYEQPVRHNLIKVMEKRSFEVA